MMNTLPSYVTPTRGDFKSLYHNQSVDDLIMAYMENHHVPGMVMAIVQAPYITRVVGYGFSDLASKRLVATNTVFPLGQISNLYTAIAIMQLKEEGKLRLNDSISNYLENSPKDWQPITLRELMTHSSGIVDYTGKEFFDYAKNYQPADIIKIMSDDVLSFKPGTQMQTSASNFYLLGLIVEKASGVSYQDYVTKNQIERLGLKNTFFISNIQSIQNELTNDTTPFKHSKFLENPGFINPIELASGYKQSGETLAPAPKVTWTSSFSSSGMVASAQDVSQWDIGLAGNILIKDPEDRRFIYGVATIGGKAVPASAGWLFPGHPGLMEIKGHVPGYSTFLSRFTLPEELVCVTLLANKENLNDLDILARKIASAFDSHLRVPDGAYWSETIQSPHSVKETMARVKHIIQKKGGTVFADIDHAAEAKKVHQTLLDTEVVIVGNPAKGTGLMQANSAIALDLPLRIMATKDSTGQVWLSFTNPVKLAQAYRIDTKKEPALQQIYAALLNVCEKAVSAQSNV